ncbi:MAG: hypothetical protein CMJ46_11365, partial [Planctomyces sp.]|nr:hypothetical protein [Planctomyces sp.]
RSNNATETVTFNTDDHSYSFSSFKSMNRPSDVYTVWLDESPHNTQITSFLHSDDGSSISFNGFGIPDCTLEITITSGSESKTITVEDITGRVEIAD